MRNDKEPIVILSAFIIMYYERTRLKAIVQQGLYPEYNTFRIGVTRIARPIRDQRESTVYKSFGKGLYRGLCVIGISEVIPCHEADPENAPTAT